jgi:hypothetical protein
MIKQRRLNQKTKSQSKDNNVHKRIKIYIISFIIIFIFDIIIVKLTGNDSRDFVYLVNSPITWDEILKKIPKLVIQDIIIFIYIIFISEKTLKKDR